MPESVGPYRILGRLGVGGMGAVYRAYDERLRRQVAIKHIPPELGDDRSRQRLKREAQAAAGLSHPSIVQIFDIFEHQGVDWIVMELVEGVTLHSLIEDGRLGLAEAVGLSREIAEGLAEAHRKGIVHRDLKTENVMVTRALHAKILDFGLAKQMRMDQTEATLTGIGLVLGTGRAMSPEQAMGEDVDTRSDLFSLGTLIFEAVTRRSPFTGTSVYNTLTRVCSSPHEPARAINPRVPTELSNLIDRLLEKNPEHRPQSAGEVVVELRLIEKQPLPEWGGPYALPARPSEAEVTPAFHDLDLESLPGPDEPPEAKNFAELAAAADRRPRGEADEATAISAVHPAHSKAPAILSTDVTEEVPAYVPAAKSPVGRARWHSGCFLKAILAVRLTGESGDVAPKKARQTFEQELRRLALELEGQRLSTESAASADAQLLIFERPLLAVRFALAGHAFVERRRESAGKKLNLHMGLHVGEVTLGNKGSRLQALGTSLDVARDLAVLAWPGQTLLTPESYSLARRTLREQPLKEGQPRWHGHGRFYLDRLQEAVELWALSADAERSRLLPHDSPHGRRLVAIPRDDSNQPIERHPQRP